MRRFTAPLVKRSTTTVQLYLDIGNGRRLHIFPAGVSFAFYARYKRPQCVLPSFAGSLPSVRRINSRPVCAAVMSCFQDAAYQMGSFMPSTCSLLGSWFYTGKSGRRMDSRLRQAGAEKAPPGKRPAGQGAGFRFTLFESICLGSNSL